jgi:Kef-type K+ transport system membrane component KefB
MSNELTHALQSLFVVALVAALAPLVVGLIPRLRVPQVVVLIVGGVIVGPQLLGLAQPESIVLLSHVGLGFLFLLAGYELTWRFSGSEPASWRSLLGWPPL